jgi:hypothetical protein
LVICGGGTVVGIPAAWVLRTTIEASRGAPSPDAAANTYMIALAYGNEDGLLPVLDNDHQDTLLTQWRAYRDAMTGTTPPPSKLDYGALAVGPIDHGRADVTADVTATWWGTPGSGAAGYRSPAHTWRLHTREDHGWQITAVDAFPWCGGYVRPDACAK